MALRNYTAHSSADAEDLDTEDLLNLACLACWLTAHLYCSAQDEALAHMRHVRDEIAEELGRTIDPRRIRPGVPSGQAMAGGSQIHTGNSAAKGGRSHARAITLTARGAFPF